MIEIPMLLSGKIISFKVRVLMEEDRPLKASI